MIIRGLTILKKIIIKLFNIVKGELLNNSVYAYWGLYPNFGDQLTPVLLKYYGYTPIYSNYKPSIKYIRKAEFISVGSLLENTPKDYSGIILGTGMGDFVKKFEDAKVLGVRGYLTKKNMKIEENIIVGDPGLLMSYVYPKNIKKKWDMGIVPHFVDKNDPIINQWKDSFGERAKIIDVQRKPRLVIKDIKRCRNIISSSLHGLVVADSYGIPNIMFVIRRNIPKKRDHKYRDYYTALGKDLELIEVNGTEELDYLLSRVSSKKEFVEPIKKDLNKVFQELNMYIER